MLSHICTRIATCATIGLALIAGAAAGAAAESGGLWGPPAAVPVGADHGLPDAVRSGKASVEPFVPGIRYDASIPSPEDFLGFPLGSRPVHCREILSYLEAVARATPRVRLMPFGTTHEGRPLVVAAVSSETNMAQIETIREDLARWADPRRGAPPDPETLPLCIWAGCTIHGDETSGGDAALFVVYHLAAAEDPETAQMRDRLLILVDPMQNPDGRERILSQWEFLKDGIPDGDDQSLRHRGLWPGGRTNHYFFDLNRDWLIASQPETQARARLVTSWNPQIMIDAHEMGAQATYLFSPPREPFNPSISEYNHFWWRIFSRDQAAAFDQHGWEYYTRDWNEEWFPGYGSSWAAGIGAVGILYEQAGVDGSRVARVDGTVMTYRETVHHQITSFLTNFHTAVLHHDELLRSFRGEREKELSAPAGAYVIIAQAQPAREEFLLRALDASGIEVFRLTRDVTIPGLRSYGSDAVAKADVPRGSLVIPERQPFGRLVQALFGFDPQMDDEFLRTERRRLEKEGLTRLYEVTAWSVSLSSGLPVYHAGSAPGKDLEPTAFDFGRAGCVIRPEAGFGFVIDGTDDRCLRALVRLVESGCKVHAARKPFVMEGRPFARGSLLVKRVLQNRLEPVADGGEDALLGVLSRVARETGVTIIGAATALMDEGPDLGSSEFRQIEPPAVGIFAGEGISPNSYGAIAWLLDHETGFGFAALPAGETERLDLDRYNVLILPNASDGPDKYASALGAGGLRKLRAWVRDGGTLIAMGTGAAFVADSTSSLGTVRLRRQVLAELAKRTGRRLAPGKNGETPPVLEFRSDLSEGDFCSDELRWAKAPGRMDGLLEDGVTALRRPEPFWMWAVGKPPDELEAEDARMRLYHPRGAILRVDLDEEHWLSAGCGVFRSASVPACGEEETGRTPRTLPLYGETSPCWMPVQTYGEYAFVASDPADIVGAYAPEDSLRLAGLLWPEARERWARTAYLTRERVGEGQIILFGTAPCQRGAFKAAERAFLNAVLLGPGLGTSREWPWSDARR